MRPIDADELEKSLENYSNDRGLINIFVEFLNVMDGMHTLDVKPVVHGEWIERIVRGEKALYCSICDDGLDALYHYDFCPNCGADMRKEQNNANSN